MLEHLNELPYNAYGSYGHKDKKALLPWKEVAYNVLNFDHDDHCILDNHLDLDDGNQQEFGIGDRDDELKITQDVPDPVDIESNIILDVVADVKV
ncbi:hypothetical protein J1N35_035161 [Gossypium stocksii]|uniref:Uncharacterized protein n=1 Tax=Gossypium stocksii TaxID=47602 RepID=A0A9D3ZPW8_9ROSI|nr:hypothetical protein J1N35_035161 [Gossypium stocksii]